MVVPSMDRHFPAPWQLGLRALLIGVFATCSIATNSTWAADTTRSEATEALRRACQYLWSRQAEDGAWRSTQYAVLRSGQALTPFVLHTLLGTIDAMSAEETDRVTRAIEFIRQHVDEQGALGRADPEILEYPVYSSAYALLCLRRVQTFSHLRSEENERLIARLEEYLMAAQFEEDDGFTAKYAAYGGWGFDQARFPGMPGHMDLAHTRRALEALRRSPAVLLRDQPWATRHATMCQRAMRFLQLVQNHSGGSNTGCADGGFYFSPVVLAANKGREEEHSGIRCFRSYATATCDGVLALLAAGVPREDERVVRAAEWLQRHDVLDYPQGIPMEHPEPWGEALRFYHYAVRAEAYAALNWPGDWRTRLAAEVARHQAPDGSFRNTASPLMKEDDPLLCTALATIALVHCAGCPSAELANTGNAHGSRGP